MISGQGFFAKFVQKVLTGAIGDLRDCTYSLVVCDATAASTLDASDSGSAVFGDIATARITHGPNALTKHADFLNANRLMKFEDLVDGLTDHNNANNSNSGSVLIWYISAGADDGLLHLVRYSTTATNLPLDQDGSPDTYRENAGGTMKWGA